MEKWIRYEEIPYKEKPQALKTLEDINDISILLIEAKANDRRVRIRRCLNDLVRMRKDTVGLNEDVGEMINKKINIILGDYLDYITEIY